VVDVFQYPATCLVRWESGRVLEWRNISRCDDVHVPDIHREQFLGVVEEMKRDINFIKHIKPQLKERERVDKAFSRDHQADKAFRSIGIDPHKEGIGVEEIGIFNAILKRLKGGDGNL
jgi:hypothetical protein